MSDVHLDTPLFRNWLATRLRRDVAIGAVERPPAGQSNDTLLFDVAIGTGSETIDRRLVARLQPAGRQIFLTADVVREGRVVAAVDTAPVPGVIGVEPDASILGRPFFVMDHVEGRVPLARPSIHRVGWLTELTVDERATLWDSAMDALVAVHRSNWQLTHAFLLDGRDPSASLAQHVERLVEWYRWTVHGRSHPVTDAGIDLLVAELPTVASTTDAALVWGDARVGNMIFGDDLRVAAVIDWEVATIGPPAIDLAHWLFFDDFMTTASGIDPLPGWPDRATTITEYERRTGRPVVDLAYFELMDELFMATTLIRQSDFRVERGLAPADTRMGHDNAVTQMLARRLDLPVPGLSPDYLTHRGLATTL